MDMRNPIAAAVMPLKADAVQRAERDARSKMQEIERELTEANWDINIAAPYPNDDSASRSDDLRAIQKRNLFRQVTRRDPNRLRPHGTVSYVTINSQRVEEFIRAAREDAATSYDAFVEKLISKIGEVESATLDGSHVWGESRLCIVKTGGIREVWRTHCIVNMSKYGRMFNQWPTKRVEPNQTSLERSRSTGSPPADRVGAGL